MAEPKTITLGELRRQITKLEDLSDETEVFFGSGDLSFNRVQSYGYKADNKTPTLLNIEFNEVYTVTPDPNDAA